MKNVFSHLHELLLIVCPTLYGPIAADGNWAGGPVLAMHTCADGVAKIVNVDASGTPAEPAHEGGDCPPFCEVIGAQPRVFYGERPYLAAPYLAALEIEAKTASSQMAVLGRRNTRPMPHRTLEPVSSARAAQGLAYTDQTTASYNDLRAVGRPSFMATTA
tara:strand:+ start:119 stop:601 length:483 start_codon:yes stop_codon:yes gene_type:complete